MAVIHHTVLKPTKLELLTTWLPSRPWYAGGAGGAPQLAMAGGFRLDDPRGEVGIEFIVATDTSGSHPAAYLVPLTYRGAPLPAAEHALVGTMEHGVLGRRWVYDGCHDPVLVAQLLALVDGQVQAQDQNTSDTPDPDVVGSFTGEGSLSGEGGSSADAAALVTDEEEDTVLTAPHGATLRLHRVLRPAPTGATPPPLPPSAIGHVAGGWQAPDGARARGLFAVLHAARA